MHKISLITALFITISSITISCGDNKNEYIKPSIEGKWVVGERIIVSDQNDEESLELTQKANKFLKINAKDDFRIEKTYIRRGENEERGLVGDIQTKYIKLNDESDTQANTNEFELKGDSITIYDGNIEIKGRCNIGEKILSIKRKVTITELLPILESIGLSISDEIPDGYTGTYTTYEYR